MRLFGAIAGRYDLTNHLLSGGLDLWWRRCAAQIIHEWRPSQVLDVATGSGDLALAISKACPAAKVVGTDFCLPMLQVARRKGVTSLALADGLRLPFAGGAFDAVTIAFGLRNMASWQGGLAEMARVLRPGGHVLILDFSLPRAPWRGLYRLYLHHLLPMMAALLTRRREAYEYLGASIETFPQGEVMNSLIAAAGFDEVKCRPMSGGIVSLYSGRRMQVPSEMSLTSCEDWSEPSN
jgi:demethylmenaquinone methyltransferase/2-methoxy-6-polyprenyl-1,4-benzoquinol methylase